VEIKMTEVNISRQELIDVLRKTAADLKQHVNELRDLDAALGDGDLGVTIDLGANAMTAYLAATVESDIGKLLARMGMDINKVNPSTFGTLLASGFMGAGKAVTGKTALSVNDLILIADGAVEAIKKRGKAEVGDKTMLDALVPAVSAFKNGCQTDGNLRSALHKASVAAKEGLEATAAMKAKFGRVSWRPDGGMGTRDGGAAAMYFLIESFTANLDGALK
jgi:phosphoenolpyruvate---glycerone phosphotransferase subunit DhaL